MVRQDGDTHQESYVPTTIKAVQLAQLKAKQDTNIIGSTVSGKKVEVDTGRDLHMQSLQDVDNFKEHSKSGGFLVSSKPNIKNPTGTIGISIGRIDSKWKSVTHQAGIYAGEDGYDINVGNGTILEGAIIKSEAPKAKNRLTTKSLEMKYIQNEAEYSVRENGVQYNKFGDIKSKSKDELNKIYKELGLTPTGGLGANGKSTSVTKSVISDGIITKNGDIVDVKMLNNDIEHSLNTLQVIFNRKSIEEKQELANLFSINANEAIHQIAKHEGWKDGDPRKIALHALFGGATSSLGGSKFSEGAYVGGLTEAMMPELEKMAGTITGPDGKKYVNPERLQQIAYIFGYAVNKSLGQSGQSGAYVARMGAKYNQEGDWTPPIATDQVVGGESIDTQAYNVSMRALGNPTEVISDEEQYTESYMPPIETDQVVGGESEATQAYNVSMNAISNPTEVTSKDINRAINVTGGVAGSSLVGRALHYEGMQLTDKVISTNMAQKIAKPLAKSATKAVLMEVGGLAGDTTFTAINMNQNRIEFEGRPDLIEKADELDETSLAIGAGGSAATMVVGAAQPVAGVAVGGVAILGNTVYGFNAELEKEKLREEYRQWKQEVKNE